MTRLERCTAPLKAGVWRQGRGQQRGLRDRECACRGTGRAWGRVVTKRMAGEQWQGRGGVQAGLGGSGAVA